MKEILVVSLTSWKPRMNNIPAVLDSIFNQTYLPDVVMLNLAFDEEIPEPVRIYLEEHKVEVNRVPDTKVYKKLLPALAKYPDACIVNIDDDWIYPREMLMDFVRMHELHPDNPISGNREYLFGMQCHCGCASLTKASFFGDDIMMIDDEVIRNCPSDDLVYTYILRKRGLQYFTTEGIYFENMQSFRPVCSFSSYILDDPIDETWDYLEQTFGPLDGGRKERLNVVMSIPETFSSQKPYFRNKLQSICGVTWQLDAPEGETDYKIVLNAVPSHVNECGNWSKTYGGFRLRNIMTDAVLSDGIQFTKILELFRKDAELGMVYSREAYWTIPVFNHKDVFSQTPQIYMARPGKTKARSVVVDRKLWLAKCLKAVFSLNYYGKRGDKYLIVFGFAFKIKSNIAG